MFAANLPRHSIHRRVNFEYERWTTRTADSHPRTREETDLNVSMHSKAFGFKQPSRKHSVLGGRVFTFSSSHGDLFDVFCSSSR